MTEEEQEQEHEKQTYKTARASSRSKTLTGAQSISSTQAITLADIIIESPDSIS